MWYRGGWQLFREVSSFPGFSRAITDTLRHIFGIRLLWKHVLINSVSQVITFSRRLTENSLWMPSGAGDFPSLSWLRPTLTSSMVNCFCRSGLSVLHNRSVFNSLIICLSNVLSLDSVRPFRTTCLPMSSGEMGHTFLAETVPVKRFTVFQAFLDDWVKSMLLTVSIQRSCLFLSSRSVNADAEEWMVSGLSVFRYSLYSRLHSSSYVGI